jgi:hypothetical protein
MKDLNKMLESLSDEEWSTITLRIDSKRAHNKAETFRKMKHEAIQFGNWILKHNVEPGFDENLSACWIRKNPTSEDDIIDKHLTSQELYLIYFLGTWDEISDEEYENGSN